MTVPTEDRRNGHSARGPGVAPASRTPPRVVAFVLLCAASLSLAGGYAWWSTARRASFVREVSLPPIDSLAELEAPLAREGSAPPVGGAPAAPVGGGYRASHGAGFAPARGSGYRASHGAGFGAARGDTIRAVRGGGFGVARGDGFGGAHGSGFGVARGGGGFRTAPGSSTRRPGGAGPCDRSAAGRSARSRWTALAGVACRPDGECGRPHAGKGRRCARSGRPGGAGRR